MNKLLKLKENVNKFCRDNDLSLYQAMVIISVSNILYFEYGIEINNDYYDKLAEISLRYEVIDIPIMETMNDFKKEVLNKD